MSVLNNYWDHYCILLEMLRLSMTICTMSQNISIELDIVYYNFYNSKKPNYVYSIVQLEITQHS